MRLASRFGLTHSIRQERPLTNDELVKVVPSVFSEEKHNSRSDRYTYIPTITLLDKLREEGFQPFFACQSRVRDEDKRGHTKHMVRLRREGGLTLSGTKTHVKQRFLPLTPLLMVSDVLWSPVLPA
ncbi:DUF932 domain-containing protein [Klebsiella pneumoniae]|uniref:DUF932 domain-containing protein n=1 Tax=Klebsiella pneumoniae TaxID=573 RepID=UPI0039757225